MRQRELQYLFVLLVSCLTMNVQGLSVSANRNHNTQLETDGCSGSVENNKNTAIRASSCQIDVLSNTNCQIETRQCAITMQDNMNTVVLGGKMELLLQDNQNCQIKGEGNSGMVSRNQNLQVNGNNLKGLNLLGNMNVQVDGNGGTVEAENATNVKIGGDNQSISLKNVAELDIQTAPHGVQNRFEVKVLRQSMWSWFGGNAKPLHFSADYVTTGKVVNDSYSLGFFQFNLHRTPKEIVVDLQSDVSVQKAWKNSILLRGNSGSQGGEQTLLLAGPKIRVEGNPPRTVRIDTSIFSSL